MTLQGIDALNPPPSGVIKSAGKAFVVRYTKDCTAAELEADRAAGVLTVMVFESTGTDFSLGFTEGVRDAQLAQEQLAALGIPSAPVYFAIDQGTSNYSAVNAYLDGCASVLGLSRTGVYGDANVCTNARGHATYFWQTYAWSGGVAEGWVHLYQYLNGQTIDGYTVDLDKTVVSDTEFGQVKWSTPVGMEDDMLFWAKDPSSAACVLTNGAWAVGIPSEADLIAYQKAGVPNIGLSQSAFNALVPFTQTLPGSATGGLTAAQAQVLENTAATVTRIEQSLRGA